MPNTLLVVDDDPVALHAVGDIVRGEFRVVLAADGLAALRSLRHDPLPALILLDVVMPVLDGYEVCARLKRDVRTAGIPVIFLSGRTSSADIEQGLEAGAVDFMSKPIVPSILLARVRTHLRLRKSSELLADQNRHLEYLVAERTRALQDQTAEVLRAQELTIVALGTVAETRDNETGNHVFRTQAYVKLLVERLCGTVFHVNNRNGHDWTQFWKSAPLHDIGKVGIPDRILLKPGRLTPEEFAVMKRHTRLGRQALQAAELRLQVRQSYLQVAMEIAYCHHERWNGNGYPEGISGGAIPVSARLMAVADVYDALISKRVYKSPVSHAEAVDIMRASRGSHFDPDVLDSFLDAADEFHRIALQFDDSESATTEGNGVICCDGSCIAES